MSSFARTDTSLLSRWWWTVDRWSLAALFLIAGLGIVFTITASPAVAERIGMDAFYFARRQSAYIPLALALMLAASLLSPIGVRRLSVLIFAIAYVGMVATLFIGVEIKGATRWLTVAGQSVQPSEFVKPTFAVLAAWLMAKSRVEAGYVGYVFATGLLAVVVGVLIKQPDIGTTILLCGTWGLQIFLAGCPLAVVGLIALGFVGAGVGAYFVFEHVRNRVDHFLDPSSGEGYQVARALEAFRSGGLFGRGPGEGHVKEVLPDAHADFIFAVAGEEFGLLVCLIVVGLFAFIVLRGLARAFRDHDVFAMLAAGGLLAQFGMQALMNMASTMHLIPPKGITLPFISYGGSSTLALALAMGMMLALTRERPNPGVTR